MADYLLSQILQHELDHEVIISAIKSGLPIKFKDISIPLLEFIPHFLASLHEKLNISTTATSTYFSPRQLEKRKKEKNDLKKDDGEIHKGAPKKSARLSLQYASSSPMKTIHEGKYDGGIKGISPIKGASKTSSQHTKKRSILTSPLTSSNTSKNNFELNSLEDFPSISFSGGTKNPRRIRATTVTTTSLSFNTSKCDAPQNNSFLEESCFESQHCDPSLDKLFLDDKRFAKSLSDSSYTMSVDGSTSNSNGNTCDELDLSLMNCSSAKKLTPTKTFSDHIDIGVIQDKDAVDVMVEIYVCIWMSNLIPNFTMELYFLFVTLTLPAKVSQQVNFTHPFRNVESCIYFAVVSLQRLVGYIVLLDEKSLNLLVSNSRVKIIASAEFVEKMQETINDDLQYGMVKKPDIIKSPMTGIPFQVESDNRKSFVCDKHFYSFSKKRDAFYALVREWQDNYLDPDWNMKQFMNRKVPDLMRMNTEINTHYQFAKLFVAQLLEMCRNYVGNKTNQHQDSDSSLLIDLKKRNPSKYQSLQDRLTQPSFSNDPCPKPSFSIVEKFFKEFIDIADSYCFSKILKHVLISYILEINASSFGIGLQDNSTVNKSDFAESLWLEIKNAVSELRLLAKFLGYVVFLPYNYSSEYIDENISKSRHMLAEPLDFSEYLCNSYKNHKLLITVPWIVDFFSMADKHAFEHAVYTKTIKYLVCLYQCTYTRLKNNSLLLMCLMLHMGWLFDLPHVEPLNFYEPDPLIVNMFHTDNVVGVDDLVTVDKEFLYMLCPYLSDIKKPLVDYAKGANTTMSGSFRKITPVRTSDAFSIDMRANLKVQLIDSLMRYVSNQVKDVMKFVTEKHFANIKHHMIEVLIPTCCQNVLEKMKQKFRICEDVGLVTPEELKLNNNDVYKEHFDRGKEEVSSQGHEFVKSYLTEKVLISLVMLLPESTHKKVLEVASKVVKHNIRTKLQEWMSVNSNLYPNEINQLYSRYVMSIIKTNKDTSA